MSHSTVLCPHCGANVSASAKFCRTCGKPIEAADSLAATTLGSAPTPPAASLRTCPHCGSNISATAKFCRACGKTIEPSAARPAAGAAVRPRKRALSSPLLLVGAAAVVCICITLVSLTAGGIWLTRPTTPQFTLGPAKTYAVSAAKDTRITDSATGQTFRFPDGGSGNLEVAKITSGPAAPGPGEGIWIDYKGSTKIQLMLKDKGDLIELWGYGAHPILSRNTWIPMSQGESTDGHRTFALYMPSQRQSTLESMPVASLVLFPRLPASNIMAAPPATRTVGFNQYWISRLLVTDTIAIRELYIRNQISDTVESVLRMLPTTLQNQSRIRVNGDFRWQYRNVAPQDTSYTGFSQVLGIREPRLWLSSAPADTGFLSGIPHEVGHYMHHVLVGDATYLQIETRDVSRPDYENHGWSTYWPGRTFFLEEPAYFTEYALGSSSMNFDEPWTGLYGSGQKRPDKMDIPSLEGFGAAFLAALHRPSENIRVRDSSGKLVNWVIPTIGLSHGELFEILSTGVQNINQLYTEARSYLNDHRGAVEVQKLAVIAQRIGWTYTIKGRLVDGSGKPLGSQKVQSIGRVDCRDYEGGWGMTASDGTFLLYNVFPGDSLIRTDPAFRDTSLGYSSDNFAYIPITVNRFEPTDKTIDVNDLTVNKVTLKLNTEWIKSDKPGTFAMSATATGIPSTVKNIIWSWLPGGDNSKDAGVQSTETSTANVSVWKSSVMDNGTRISSYPAVRVSLYDNTCGKLTLLAQAGADATIKEEGEVKPPTETPYVPSTPTPTRTSTRTPTVTPFPKANAPQILSVELPVMLGDGTPASGRVRFSDLDGDINWAAFDVVSGDFNRLSFNPLAVRPIEGDAKNGVFEFRMSCLGASRKGTLQLTLSDAAGNDSSPYTFNVECRGTATATPTATATKSSGAGAEPCPALTATTTANGKIGPFAFSIFRTNEGAPFEPRTRFPGGVWQVHAFYDYAQMRSGTQARALWCRNGNVYNQNTWAWNWEADGSAWTRVNANPMPSGDYELRMYLGGSLAQVGRFTIDPQQSGTPSVGAIRFAEGQKDNLPVNLHASGQNFKYGAKSVFGFYEIWYAPSKYTLKAEWYRNGTLDLERSTQYDGGVVKFNWSSHFHDQSPLEAGNYELRLYIDNRLVKSGSFVIQ